jgi:hypothetical protein
LRAFHPRFPAVSRENLNTRQDEHEAVAQIIDLTRDAGWERVGPRVR